MPTHSMPRHPGTPQEGGKGAVAADEPICLQRLWGSYFNFIFQERIPPAPDLAAHNCLQMLSDSEPCRRIISTVLLHRRMKCLQLVGGLPHTLRRQGGKLDTSPAIPCQRNLRRSEELTQTGGKKSPSEISILL